MDVILKSQSWTRVGDSYWILIQNPLSEAYAGVGEGVIARIIALSASLETTGTNLHKYYSWKCRQINHEL